jgi:sigma-B regulation protein RsbU (phosphoserine phosphatase)
MNDKIIDLIIALIRNISIFMILAYLLTRIPVFGDVLNRRFSGVNRVILALVFGLVSIYGTMTGIEIFGGIANFRDLGPAVAGLLAGPLVGTVAGLIGGIYRYPLGGVTALPCALAPVMAGLAGGILFLLKKGKDIRVWEATLLMIGMEILHAVISLIISGAGEEVLAIIRVALFPMIVANGCGMAVFVFMIDNLATEKRNEAAKQRIDSELRIAREIQMSMVPRPRPSYAEHPGADIHAVMKPAKEVGGDLYNFFPIDADRLCLAIGDVAGKGVPASLYMAITQKLIKAEAREGVSPADLLARLNNELCDGNDTLTFVTLFLGFFDRRTGEVIISNAGHNPPYLVRPAGAEMLEVAPAMAVGVQEDIPYVNQSIQLQPGETFFLYTDGVTEAMDAGEKLYSDDRLRATLSSLCHLQPEAMCREILVDIARFVGSNEQSDDITMLALRFNGREQLTVS